MALQTIHHYSAEYYHRRMVKGLTDLRDYVEEAIGGRLTSEGIDQFVGDDDEYELWDEILKYGVFEDTATRDRINNRIAKLAEKSHWPTYGDQWGEDELDVWLTEVKAHLQEQGWITV